METSTEDLSANNTESTTTEPTTTEPTTTEETVTEPTTTEPTTTEPTTTEPTTTEPTTIEPTVTEETVNKKVDPCFVIYGFIDRVIVDGLIKYYANVNDKIVSTYKDYDPNLINVLKDNGFIVVLNNIETNTQQRDSELLYNRAAAEKALELGYTHTIHMLSELYINDAALLRDTVTPLIQRKMSSLCWFMDTTSYILNYVLAGPIVEVLKYYKLEKEENDPRFVQQFTQENYLEKRDVVFEDTTSKFNYSIKLLKDANITINWTRYPIDKFSEYTEVIESFYNIKVKHPKHDIKY